eukprot:357275-Alexandrium_andersonii.AAC.1
MVGTPWIAKSSSLHGGLDKVSFQRKVPVMSVNTALPKRGLHQPFWDKSNKYPADASDDEAAARVEAEDCAGLGPSASESELRSMTTLELEAEDLPKSSKDRLFFSP